MSIICALPAYGIYLIMCDVLYKKVKKQTDSLIFEVKSFEDVKDNLEEEETEPIKIKLRLLILIIIK